MLFSGPHAGILGTGGAIAQAIAYAQRPLVVVGEFTKADQLFGCRVGRALKVKSLQAPYSLPVRAHCSTMGRGVPQGNPGVPDVQRVSADPRFALPGAKEQDALRQHT